MAVLAGKCKCKAAMVWWARCLGLSGCLFGLVVGRQPAGACLAGWLLERLVWLCIVLAISSSSLVWWLLPARFPESTLAKPPRRFAPCAESIQLIQIGDALDLKVVAPNQLRHQFAQIRNVPDSSESNFRLNRPNRHATRISHREKGSVARIPDSTCCHICS